MNKEFLIKCWKHPRWHSLMVLIIWLVSLTILIGIFSLIGEFKRNDSIITTPEFKQTTYDNKLLELINNDYEFIYTININEEIIKYEGAKKGGLITGYRERIDDIIRYLIEDNLVYEIRLEEKNIIDNLYENINSDFLNLNYLYNLISNTDVSDIIEEDNVKNHLYSLILDNSELKIAIVESETIIDSITIEFETGIYTLVFKRI